MKRSLPAALLILIPFAALWAEGYIPRYDLDSDGRIDKSDLYLLQLHWNTEAETPVPTPTNTFLPTDTPTPTLTLTPTITPTFGEPIFSIGGQVFRFPGCTGVPSPTVQVILLPLGRTTGTGLFDGSFLFENLSNGQYTLRVSPQCNETSCYPDETVTVFEDDIFGVQLCPVPFTPTPTVTPMPTLTPTETPLP